MRQVEAIALEGREGLVIVRDPGDSRPTAEQAFGTLGNEAAALFTHGRVQMWLDPPPELAASESTRPALPVVGEIAVEGGRARRSR
jgi:hypothetical protein